MMAVPHNPGEGERRKDFGMGPMRLEDVATGELLRMLAGWRSYRE